MRSDYLCALLLRLLSWCHPRGIGLRSRHIPGCLNIIADKLSRRNQSPDRVVHISAGFQSLVLKMGAATCGAFLQPSSVTNSPSFLFTGTRSNSLGNRHPESAVGESGCLHLPSSLPARSHNLQGDGSRLSQDDSDCSRVVQHALVLGPGQFYRFRSLSGSLYKGSGNTAR